MPCDTSRRTPIVFEKLEHKFEHVAILAEALKRIGYNVVKNNDNTLTITKSTDYRNTGSYRAGVFNVPNTWKMDQNEVKRAYSAQVIREKAKKMGWRLTERYDTEGNLQLVTTR